MRNIPTAGVLGRSEALVLVALANATVLLASSSQAAHLAMLVHRVADPIDARIVADGLVERVHKDNLVPL